MASEIYFVFSCGKFSEKSVLHVLVNCWRLGNHQVETPTIDAMVADGIEIKEVRVVMTSFQAFASC